MSNQTNAMYTYPEQFHTGILPTQDPEMSKEDYHKSLLADACCAWGTVYTGTALPTNFGMGMANTALVTGVSMDPKKLMAYLTEKYPTPTA